VSVKWFVAIALLASCESAKSKLDDDVPAGSGSGSGSDCSLVAERIRASYTDKQRAQFASDPKLARWFETTQQVVRESCEQDQWPASVKQCALKLKPGDPSGAGTCNQVLSARLQQKMQARMTAAMAAQK
jgi:hypothetical protein